VITLVKKIFGTANERMLKKLRPTVARINELEVEFQKLSTEQLREKVAQWKARISAIHDIDEQQRALDEVLPEAFAAVKNAARRLCGTTWQVCD